MTVDHHSLSATSRQALPTTYQMAAPIPFLAPVPPPWTEHKAPGGQPYWFNPITNVSTYTRPFAPAPPPPPPAGFPIAQMNPPLHFPAVSASSASTSTEPVRNSSGSKKDKKEKPKQKLPIEGTDWIRVTTNKGNVFYNHSITKESVWTVPPEIKDQVEQLELREQEELEQKREGDERIALRKRKAEDDAVNDVVQVTQDIEREGDHQAEDEDEEEKGHLELEIEGAPEGTLAEVPTETTPVIETDNTDAQPPKKKKPKTRVVSSIEELETEDWQRQMAEQMAQEAAEAEEKEKREMEFAMKPDEPPVVNPEAVEKQDKLEVNQVEAAAMYKVLLGEKDINPMAPFENELPKFVNDPRYHSVKTQRDRRDIFDEFCKEKIRERRAAKAKLAQSGIKVDPLVAYRALLTTTVTSTRTHFSDFKKAHGKDSRFREFGKTEGEKEKEFKKFLRELGETKRQAAEKAEQEFRDMLSEDRDIKIGDKWADVKKRHASDRRYAAVNSSSLREQLFSKHLASLASGSTSGPTTSSVSTNGASSSKTSKEDKAARAAASLREREERVRQDKDKAARHAHQARSHLGKDEAEREFGQLMIDAVRDHKAHFEDVAPSLSQDPRFDHPSLTPRDKRVLFDSHLSALHRKRVSAVEALFAEHAPALDTPFHDVLPQISDSPHVTRLFGDRNFDRVEDLFSSWQSRRKVEAKEDFYRLLKESPILEHWGRLKKMEKRDEVKLIGEEGTRNDESDDEETGAREMADQVDLKAVHATLKNDKRYLMWNHEPEKREEWIEDYVENKLTAPKMTVHQRD
ncbi:uncharacterized protein JCM15063_004280 [Sporobolomyces koalae]|uniref:uncharacterized protein n=1 Tax=Sporobolomyces koalae TaxID=500713 RepID=UPI0031725B6B